MSPWSDLGASASLQAPPLEEGRSPCAGCLSPCCWVVQVYTTVPGNLRELDFLRFCAGFEHIEIGIGAGGNWCVNYRRPCRHLTAELKCELHGTPHKPLVCQRYDEHRCLYREAFLGPTKVGYLRVNLRRFDVLLGMLTFDGDGNVTHVPPRDEILRAFVAAEAGPPPAPIPRTPPPEKALPIVWDRAKRRPTAQATPPAQQSMGWAQASETPCNRCAAPCCQVLVFDHASPADVNAIDFMEYMLGFPGLELALSANGWKVVVHTTCRYFDVERAGCSIWGRPERPLICGRYDAHACAYKSWLIEPQTLPFVRVDHDTFQRVRRHFPTTEEGEVTADLSPDQLRAILQIVAPDRLAPWVAP